MELLSPLELIKTGDVDHADWNYRPILGPISRSRYRLAMKLFQGHRFERIVELGYGSGVFLPELAARCEELYGIDVHSRTGEVSEILAKRGIQAGLRTASATDLPFEDGFADCVVAISSLEFILDLDQACREVRRVLRPGGVFVVVTPGASPLLDFGLWLLTRESASKDFGDRRGAIIPTLLSHFVAEREIRLPRVRNPIVCFYRAFRLR